MRKTAISDFTQIQLSQDEISDIFLPEKRIVCRSCRKVRIKKLISKYGFNEDHLGKICTCDEQNEEHTEEAKQQEEMKEEEKENMQAENVSNHFDDDDEFQNIELLEDNIGQQNNVGNGHNGQNHENNDQNIYVARDEFNRFKNEMRDKIQDISNRFDRTDANMKNEFKKFTNLLKKKKK